MNQIRLIGFILLILGCHNPDPTRHIVEYRFRGEPTDTMIKVESQYWNTEPCSEYKSEMIFDSRTRIRTIQLPDKNAEKRQCDWKENGDHCVLRITETRPFIFKEKEHQVVKMYYNDGSGSDVDSNMFFVEGLGIILETFWKRNTYETIDLGEHNNELLAAAIEIIKSDPKFMWNYYVN